MKLRQHIININLPYNLKEFLNFYLNDDEKDVQGFHFMINSNIDEEVQCCFEFKSKIDIFYSFDLVNEEYMDNENIKFLITKGQKINLYIYFKVDEEDTKYGDSEFKILSFEILKNNDNYELNELLLNNNQKENKNFDIIFQFSPKYHFDIYRYHLILYLSNLDDKEQYISNIVSNAIEERNKETNFIDFLIGVHKNLINESKGLFVFTDYRDSILKLIKKMISVGTNRFHKNNSSSIISDRNRIYKKEEELKEKKLVIKPNNSKIYKGEEDAIEEFNGEIKITVPDKNVELFERILSKNVFGNNFVQYKISTNRLITRPYISIVLYKLEKQHTKFLESLKNIIKKNYYNYFEILIFNVDVELINFLKRYIKSLFKINSHLISFSFIVPNKKLYKLVDDKYSLLQELIILSNISESESNYMFLIHSNSIWSQNYIKRGIEKIRKDNRIHLILSNSAKTYFPSNGKIENYFVEINSIYEKYQQCIFPIINKNILINMNPNFFIFSNINKIKDIKLLLDSVPNKKIYFIENKIMENKKDNLNLHIFE